MKTLLFIIIVLVSGALAGFIHGTVNFVIVEPYLDQAIWIENQNLFESGEEIDTPEFWEGFEKYRAWQKSGQIIAGVILGISVGSLFGIVFALSRNSLPGNSDIKKTLSLAGIMWLTLYFIPFLKYPANPPTVGDNETLALRVILYLSFIAISGFSVVGFYKLSKSMKNNQTFVFVVSYAVFISAVFFLMPENPDKISIPMELVNEFRIVSVLGISSFWISIGVILGIFWSRVEHNRKTKKYYT